MLSHFDVYTRVKKQNLFGTTHTIKNLYVNSICHFLQHKTVHWAMRGASDTIGMEQLFRHCKLITKTLFYKQIKGSINRESNAWTLWAEGVIVNIYNDNESTTFLRPGRDRRRKLTVLGKPRQCLKSEFGRLPAGSTSSTVGVCALYISSICLNIEQKCCGH